MVCGSSRLIQLFCRISMSSGAAPGSDAGAGTTGNTATSASAGRSIRLEDIAGAADGVQVARIAGIRLDFAAQAGHLHIDSKDAAAEPRRVAQALSLFSLGSARSDHRHQAR